MEKKTPEYFGFNDETINNENIILKFELLEAICNMADRKHKEKELIQKKKPILQSGISDRMKSVEEKVQALSSKNNTAAFYQSADSFSKSNN